MRPRFLLLVSLFPLVACSRGGRSDTAPAPVTVARAMMRNATGGTVGEARLQQTPNGLLIMADLSGLPPGTHAFHLHAVGRCEPDFNAAGPHFNPANRQHGIRNPQGRHAGDLPNIHVPESGSLRVEVLTTAASLAGENRILDDDGTALMIHALADDYVTDPAGAAGARIACGVIER